MTGHAKQSRAVAANGQETPATSSERPPLGVVTGAWGDHRADLEADHPHYPPAWLAWRDQDDWTDAEHAERWQLLLDRWPQRRGPHTDRDERAYIAWFLHYGHGVPLDALADQFGYTRDALYRMAVAGGDSAPPLGKEPTRVPRVFAIGGSAASAKPQPPYRVTVAQRPHRFDWDHPKPMAFRWTDVHGDTQLVLPLVHSTWEQVGPRTYRMLIARTGTVYLPDGTPLEIDAKMLDKLAATPLCG